MCNVTLLYYQIASQISISSEEEVENTEQVTYDQDLGLCVTKDDDSSSDGVVIFPETYSTRSKSRTPGLKYRPGDVGELNIDEMQR